MSVGLVDGVPCLDLRLLRGCCGRSWNYECGGHPPGGGWWRCRGPRKGYPFRLWRRWIGSWIWPWRGSPNWEIGPGPPPERVTVRLLVATRSPHKLAESRRILAHRPHLGAGDPLQVGSRKLPERRGYEGLRYLRGKRAGQGPLVSGTLPGMAASLRTDSGLAVDGPGGRGQGSGSKTVRPGAEAGGRGGTRRTTAICWSAWGR